MAAQGMIRPEGDLFRVVFPYGGQEYQVHALQTSKEAHTVLLCLMNWAMTDLQGSLDQSSAGGGAPAAMGSPQQLVEELQACVDYCNRRDPHMFDEDAPASCWFMGAAAAKGYTGVVRQLLVTVPAQALGYFDAGLTSEMPLHQAALGGHAAVFRLLLAAAPEAATAICEHDDPCGVVLSEWTLMHSAAQGGSTAVIRALLQLHPDAPCWTSDIGHTALHEACEQGHLEAMQLLLQAAPHAATIADSEGRLPLHWAAGHGQAAIVELLLAAAPEAAILEDGGKDLPLHDALRNISDELDPCLSIARLLLPVSGLNPAQLLDALAQAGSATQPLYADLAALFPLSATEWERVPTPCAGLGRALPAVLARSDAEACQLVRRLPAADQQRLRLAALCLGRAQRRRSVFLPAPLVRAILAQCLS